MRSDDPAANTTPTMALIASVVDVAFWWLARLEEPYGPMFARLIPVTGMVLAVSLLLQIVLSLFSLFGNMGKVFMVLLPVGAAAMGVLVLGEAFGVAHLAALTLAVAGLLLVTWPTRQTLAVRP